MIVGANKVEHDFLTDFVLYNFEKETFLDSFKRAIDDDLFGVTHKIETLNTFNPIKHYLINK